ncbi:IPTL-CTERM sorting domain-containing protein [Thiothrix subterranea]|uniref:IPTL-CTERM sorting domain-containing protein n=1 Tax=Thiothrix subterranea TaxID=2735563 RepID=UPI00192A7B2D|nr:IPTL-CTERM sorting domain-containing protein [Thiothrix subterranea]QQZ28160.1 IPTL-CTERM sorting domain-containing protein [Thiothrix subterranea]
MSHSPSLLGRRVLWLCVFLLFPALANATPLLQLGPFGPNDGTVDGTAPFNVFNGCAGDAANRQTAGEDCGEGNLVVRNQDVVAHSWSVVAKNYAGAANLKNVVLEQTIKPETGAVIAFERIPVVCTATGGGGTAPVSNIVNNADGSSTLTCNLGEFTEGQQKSFSVFVKVSGKSPNNSSYTSEQRLYSKDDAGVENATGASSPVVGPILISAAPAYDLIHSISSTQGLYNRDPGKRDVGYGLEMGYYTYMMIRVAATRKTGVESITQPFSFDNVVTAVHTDGVTPYPEFEYHITQCIPQPSGWGGEVWGNETMYADQPLNTKVINSGTCEYTRSNPSDPTSDYSFTIKDADLSGNRYPTKTVYGGADLTAGPYYVVNHRVQVWIPFRTIEAEDGNPSNNNGQVKVSSALTGFDPNGVSGTSNFGALKEPGFDGALMDDNTRSNNLLGPTDYPIFPAGSFCDYIFDRENGSGASYTYLPTQSGWHSGDGEVEPGQTYHNMLHYGNSGSVNLTNPVACTAFDNSTQKPVTRDKIGAPADGVYAYVGTYAGEGFDATKYTVEYGHADTTSDDILDGDGNGTKDYDLASGRYDGDWTKSAAVRCDDAVSPGGWHTDINAVSDGAVSGVDAVNIVRVRLKDPVADSLDPGQYIRFAIPLEARNTFNGGPYNGEQIPIGTVLASFGAVKSDQWAQTWYPGNPRDYNPMPETGACDGDRVTLNRVSLRIDSESLTPVAASGKTASTLAGKQIVWKLNTSAQSRQSTAVANNVKIIDVLPPLASYNAACTLAQAGGTLPSLVEYNKDKDGNAAPGYTRLSWNLGDVTANTEIPPRIFCTDTDSLAANNSNVVNWATIRADNVSFSASRQQDDHTITLEQSGSIQLSKKVDMPLDDMNDDQVHTISWSNFAASFSINAPTVIDVFPFMSGGGDGLSSKSPRTPASNFHGKLVLTTVPTITWLNGTVPGAADPNPELGTWYYSADAPETINYDPDTNTSKWCTEAQFGSGGGCPAALDNVTAVKFVSNYALERDGNPRQGMTSTFTLQAGDTVDPNSSLANKAGDLYVNRFTMDSTSLPADQFLASNNVSVQVAAYSIGDFIFADNNQNGLYDVGVDAPAPDGITVDLYDSADKKVATTTTGVVGAGRFLFEPLASGQYYIKIPAGQFQSSGKLFGWQASVVPDGATEEGNGNETVDQHGYAAGALTSTGIRTGLITLSANPPPPGGVPTGNEPMGDNAGSITDPTGDDFSNLTLDIGLVPPPASLGDTVWNDVNQNGMQDVGEQGLSNVLVKLLDKDGVELKNLRTDSAGKYEFTNLSAGSYYVEVVRPAGYSLSAKDQGADDTSDSDMNPVDGRSALITLGFGVHDPNVDAGLFRAASIGDRVWLDANGDAVQDASETTNLANVTILLQDSAGNTLDTTDTDTNGAYLFSGLQPGNYKVKIDTTDADLVGYTLTTDNNPHSVTLAEGQAYVDADFGFVNFASVGDRVWEDRNGNGIQDDGEPGIAGVTARLLDSTGTAVVKTTTTDASGLYLFSNVTPGNYLLEFAKPDGFAGFVTASQGADLAKNSDADVLTGRTATFTLSGGATLRDFDAGLYRAASVGDLLWFDANGNGMQDVGEPGVAGTTVTLSGTRGDGAALAAISKTTDASGVYGFEDLYPGNYTVTFSLPAGMTFTSQNQGANDAQDSDVGTDGITSAVVQSGEKNLTLDAGVRPAAVSGRVWIDNNVPNAQDDGISAEDGVVGVSVNLIDTTSGAVVATTTTGADGLYTFTGVLPGSYQVQVLEPANMGFVAQNQGGDDTKDSDVEVANGKSQVFTVSSGDTVTDLDAGIEPGRLGDRVWLDLNSNNLQDSGEPGVANVTVNLLDGSGAAVATQATDATGFYDFAAVLPGAYTVQFIAPAGMTLVTANQGTDDTLDSDPSADGKIAVTIVSGVGNQTVDAGILPAKLGDFAWLDRDADGTQGATEPPVVGMTVNLLDASGNPVNDMGGNPVTAVTDANGKYAFVVLPGTYRVSFNLPAGAVFSALDQGGNDAADSDAVLATGMTPVVTLVSGDENLTLDAGLAITSVSGFVIEDRNANGTQDSGETGIAGVTLTLTGTDVFGNPVAALTTTTDANGFYRFDKLAPGTYAVSETNPANYVSSASLPGNAVGAAVVDADALTTPALGGTPSENNNFLDYRLGSIAGQVREDVDYDGELADADSGMAGVTVTLFTDPNGDGNPADGVEVATTTTNSSGAYLFNALTPGNYTVVETDFAQWQSTADTQGTNDNRIPVVLASAQASTGNDFLDAKQQGGLSGVVWTDTNTDGVRDATETGIPSVTVKVLDSNGTVVATLITDSSGVYTAANLPPGDYRVQLDPATLPAGMQQTGDPDGLLDHQTNAEVKPAQVTSGLDFGYVGNVFLGDFAWHDLNANGIQDAGEPGLAGVTATLYLDANGNGLAESGEQLQSVVTPATGAYAFHDLLPLDYLVNFTLPNGYLRSPQNQGADDAKDSDADANGQAAVSLKTGTNATIDAGFYQLGQLGDYVWLDADANGVQDAAEPVIAGMAVQLLDAAGVQLASTTTDANGRYVFADLPPAAYGVKFTAPAGMSFTSALQGGDTALDSDVDGSGMANATLVSGTNLLTVDAGITPAAITGRVWIDNDTPNATDDGVEAGVVGVGVNLIDTNTGNVVATTTTGADGIYRFIGVLPGDYQVQVIEPANMGFVKQDQGGDDSKDSDVTPTDGKSQVFTVTSGNTVSDIDAGIEPGALGDRVWLDSNGNNLQDSSEPGIANITVNLLDSNGAVVATQITDATGFYNFAAVLPGDYTVQFVVPAGMTLVTANQGLDDTLDSDPATDGKIAVTIVSGVGNQTVDAGIVPAKLGDYVWQDLNGNGKQDAAEPVVAGLVVNLLDKDGKPMLDVGGNAITTTTAQDGKYQFMVLPGEYRVGFSLPTGVAATTVDQGGDDAADSDGDPATLMTPVVTLASAAVDATLDLGLAPATVSGYVIDDANANGVQDTGERVIVGVTVTLSGKDAFGVEITETTTTDANGLYSFTVPAGQYTLKETNPADYVSSGSKAGSTAGATVIGMDEVMTPVAGGSTSERNDFFDYRVGSIAGQVRDDANYNGALTDTETGIPGVTMTLLLDDVEVARTATDSDGKYSFTNLKPGNYVIVETDLALWSSTADIDATNDNRVAVTLASAQHSTGNDFLDSKQKGSLSGVVWTDTNSDGVRDGGESVLAGVSVTVLDSSGNPVATLTTDAQGAYSAADLPPGTYTVNVDPASLPAGSQQTGDPDGVKDHQTLAVIKPSQNTSGLDFGYATLVALGDKVWHDLNANGVQDAEEPGLAGVMVALYRDANNNGSPDADEQVKAVLTDGTGAYLFSKLLPVDYLVTFSVPTGYERSPAKQGGNGDTDSDADANGHVKVSLVNGATLAVDAGFYQRGRLGDYVWLDANQNGLQEANEPAITGMTVNLLDSNGATVASTTTDAAGFYQFDKLIPGNYQVQWVAPQGIVFTQQDVVGDDALDSDANSSGIAPVVLASGQTIASVDAGILPAAVSGRVWIDRNANGLDDAAEEAGVPGVRVNLLDAKTGAVVATTTTGGDGEYNFTGILPGDYLVETVQPATMVFVTPDQGDDDTRDSDVQVASGRSPSFVLNSSTSVTDVDAGIQPGELGDHVWLDQNNNGLQDAGEAGIGNVTVNLLDGSGNVVATQATDATGFYNFTGVLPGDYSVQFVLPQGTQFTASNNGSDDALDSDVDAAGKVAVTVISTVGNQTVDAGIVPATISGTVLDDRNANGVQNDDDTPVSGVVVTVTGTDVLGNPVTLETTTDTAGHYSIAVPPGTYTVTETNPSTAVSTGSEAGTQGSTVVDKDAISVTVNSGQVSANNDFLDYMPARLSGQVRDDANGNGVLSDAENGIASISVSLWLGDTLVATEMTDTNGVYVFENVQPGTYSVRETDRNGWLSTADVDGANDNTVSVTLASGDDKPGHDFLDTYPVNITGQVRDDTDRDGDLNDADTGMPGVTVTLLLDGKPVQTTTTNDNGEYSFAAVSPGDYVITTTDPSPYAPSGDVDGGQDARIAVTVFSGMAVVDQDLLYANMQGSLGDWVWLDRNNDSLQDSSEPVLAGITVVLSGKDTAGNAVNLSTATDATGKYLFAKLVPGVYTIEYQLPLGMRLTLPNQGDNEALDSDPEILSRQVTVTLAAGEHNHNVDAGVRPALVSGALWEDRNGDGLLTRGEAPLASVPVALFTDPNGDGNPADGVQVGTTNSGVDGVYGFDGLMPGTYVVVVSPPSGYVPVPPNQGTDPAINSSVLVDRRLPVTLESGETVDKNGGFYVLGSVGDRLWLDLNSNGKQEAVEPGIRDVTLALLNQAGEPVMNPLNPELPYRVVSDVNGVYRFDNLLPGQYFVQLENLDGFVLTQTDAGTDDAQDSDANANGRMPALVQSGLHNPDVDAGLLPASVSGRVWSDHNSSNGVDDGLYAEPGMVGIVVNLLDKDGNLVATTTTGVDGIYSFSGVLPGDYQLEFVTPNSMTLVAANQGEDDTRDSDADVETGRSPLFTVTSSTGVQDVDAGIQAGTLGDRVWVDLNANGLQDSGEPGVAGVTVKLLDSADKEVALTTTDVSGFYAFRDVIPGTYTVQFVLAADMKLTATDQGDDDALDSDADPVTGKASAQVSSGAAGNQTVDAGILPTKLGDHVWLDANKNGVQDEGEMPLANVTVLLLNADGEKVASTSTDNAGNYQFSVAAGTYSVQVVAMDSAFTAATLGDNAERDSDVDNSGATPLLTFSSGITNMALDAGILPASISGKVVNDVLANGVVESTDGGIANITVTLSGTDSFGNPISLTTVSAADGSYQFLVPPGVYTLTETQLQGYVSTGSSAGSGDGSVISDDQVQVTVASNATVQDVNFLDHDPASYVVLSGNVVDDRNHNGQADAGENGLPGVDVTLFTDPNGDGDPTDGVAMETAITDSSGSFTFNGMPPGQYVVMESDPLNYESTADSAGANDNRVPVTLVSGQVPTKPLFLDAKPHGSLSGHVLLDTDKDGDLADPDNGLAGINVLLFTDPNGDGNSDDGERVDAVLTDETGRYVFTNVLAGNWVIVAVDQAGYVSTADITLPNDNRIPVVVDVVNGANECRLPNGTATCTGLDFLDAPLNSGIQLLKTAYQGHDAGAKCGTDAAKTELTLVDIDKDKRENVTYCFEITNTGDNWLAQVALLDDTLGLTADKLQALGDIPALLAPQSKDANARMRYYYEHVITAGIVNKASVTAKPALEDGTVLAGGVDTSSDSSVNVRFVFDPPTATKTVTATGEQVMLWQMVWINSSSDSVAGVEIYDGVPAGTYYAAMQAGAHVSPDGVYCETRGSSRTDICRYEAPSAEFPRGRVFWKGTIGADLGNATEQAALNEVVIRFYSVLNKAGDQQTIENQASSSWDLDADGKPEYADFKTDNGSTDDFGDSTSISMGAPAQIPTLGEWALWMLSLLMVLVAFGYRRKAR